MSKKVKKVRLGNADLRIQGGQLKYTGAIFPLLIGFTITYWPKKQYLRPSLSSKIIIDQGQARWEDTEYRLSDETVRRLNARLDEFILCQNQSFLLTQILKRQPLIIRLFHHVIWKITGANPVDSLTQERAAAIVFEGILLTIEEILTAHFPKPKLN